MEIQKVYTPEDDVRDTTKEFYDVLSELCEHIKVLKMEQWELKEEKAKSTEFIDAYDMVIQNKVWILHKLVDGFSEKVKSMQLLPKEETKKEEEVSITLPEVSTNVVSFS
jgi:hypothetical protein